MKENKMILNPCFVPVLILLFANCSGNRYEKSMPISPAYELCMDEGLKKIMAAYPDFISGITENEIIWNDCSILQFDDGKIKSMEEMLNSADLQDQMSQIYKKGIPLTNPKKNQDPGRIRNELFFRKMYGNSKEEVIRNLEEVIWLPKHLGEKIMVTKINGVAEKMTAISHEFDKHPELVKYLKNIGGTFNWRKIKGTERMSMHSYGITIDINVAHSNYWQWDCSCVDENADLQYRNRIPLKIVEIFEMHGFIWGGKWYHYDTMHFEYRPELMEESHS